MTTSLKCYYLHLAIIYIFNQTNYSARSTKQWLAANYNAAVVLMPTALPDMKLESNKNDMA
jgi:hypothetical protein